MIGLYIDTSGNIYCIKNPSNFSDNANGTKIGERPSAPLQFWPSEWSDPSSISGFEYALFPTNGISGSQKAYVCDRVENTETFSDYQSLQIGGNYTSQVYGSFSFSIGRYSSSGNGLSGRLQKLP